MKLLLVEDNAQLNKALSAVLKRNGYVLDSVFDGEEALYCLLNHEYDAAILDIMLPKMNGLEVLKRARQSGIETPIIMLTAKSGMEDKIAGLDLGADDYLPKPFHVEELLARVRALTRRRPVYANQKILEYGDLRLDPETAILSCKGKEVVLPNKEMLLMSLLLENGERIVSQERIIERVWNADETPISDNVWVFVSYLRKKMESIGSKTKIKSVRYRGYSLESDK